MAYAAHYTEDPRSAGRLGQRTIGRLTHIPRGGVVVGSSLAERRSQGVGTEAARPQPRGETHGSIQKLRNSGSERVATMSYPQSFEEAMVHTMMVPNSVTAIALAEEVGVAQRPLSRWRREARTP